MIFSLPLRSMFTDHTQEYNMKMGFMFPTNIISTNIIDQCIAFVHYSAQVKNLWTFTVFYCRNLYFFMLHFFMLYSFHVALFTYCTISMLHFFCVVIFSCCIFFRVARFLCIALFYVAVLHVAVLHSSLVALFPCCNFFPLLFVHAPLFSEM